ncbi:MAG: TAXI family TRAP transporter solute-binding subunit [Alphaproteobacteria bacterium]|nr:TAXI family TRAP transporter solute-binding subunit [Alphaproteobacteria bacterium]
MKAIVAGLTGLMGLVALTGAAAAQVVTIGSNPQGALLYNVAVAVAKVMDEKMAVQARVQPMAGTSTYLPLMNRAEMDLGLANVDELQTAVAGTAAFEGKPNPNLRVVATLFPLPLGLAVPADSTVRRTADLKGLRMGGGYPGQTTARVVQEAMLANGGLGSADIRPVPMVNLFAAIEGLAQGKVDAAVISPSSAQVHKAHTDLAGRGGLRFVSIETDAAAVERMRKLIPSRPMQLQPSPQHPGMAAPTWTMAYSMFVLANNQTADDLVYRLAATLHKSRDDLARTVPALAAFDPARMTERVAATWHPGAARFYREIGQWPPRD